MELRNLISTLARRVEKVTKKKDSVPVRVERDVPVSQVRSWKYNKESARRIAGFLQNGEEFGPVHLQKVKGGEFDVCKKGRDLAAAYVMLGRQDIPARYSSQEKKEVDK